MTATPIPTEPKSADRGDSLLSCAIENGIRRIELRNPANRNALSTAMMGQLQEALDRSRDDGQTRVIVICGQGSAFCAGHDLRELDAARQNPDHGRAFFTAAMRQCATLMQSIVNHPRPIIADVRGTATAAGCQLVASCDLAIAADSARFATPGVNIGLFCSTPMVALSRKVGRNHAMSMLLTGDFVDAQEAARIGLVNRICAPDEIDAVVKALAVKIASKSLMTLKTGKQAFYSQADMPLADAYDYTTDIMIENMLRHDAREGVIAFLEKRDPKWQDK